MHIEDAADADQLSVAVIGMAARFPCAATLDAFWENIANGRDCIATFTQEELREAALDEKLLSHPNAVFRHGIAPDMRAFDAAFFGFTARDAVFLNPQNRILLETAYLALEQAGCAHLVGSGERPNVGVFIGSSQNDYQHLLSANVSEHDSAGQTQIAIGNGVDFAATLVSYKLGLCGPSLNIQTGCSSSLVAVHAACQSLLSGECDIAIAGGISFTALSPRGYIWQAGSIKSPDGVCRPFSADAAGAVGGDGVGIVVLRRLDDARACNDDIAAVVRGSAINNDGSDKAGFTAPSIQGQVDVITSAMRLAGVNTSEVGFIEAHGTGTLLGDPIEFQALCEAFADNSQPGQIALGSVKANIGHLDAAAGIAGFIKAVLAVRHGEIPPLTNFSTANPACRFTGSPFYVPREKISWTERRRVASVSSFGIGGTNAHVIIESSNDTCLKPVVSTAAQLVLVSAKDPEALQRNSSALISNWCSDNSEAAAYCLARRRPYMASRGFAILTQSGGLPEAIGDSLQSGSTLDGLTPDCINFIFPGQGTLSWADLDGLMHVEGECRTSLLSSLDLLETITDKNIRELLDDSQLRQNPSPLADMGLEQALIVATQLAVAKYLASFGINPAAVCGHSVGEYTAAVLAGVMSVEQALRILVERGRLCARLRGGAMATLVLSPAVKVDAWIAKGLSVAAINSADLLTLSGPELLIEELQTWAQANNVLCKRLAIRVAYHSSMTDAIRNEFETFVSGFTFAPPSLEIISTVTGKRVGPDMQSPTYWGRHLRDTVQFFAATATLRARTGSRIFIEVGPGAGLSHFFAAPNVLILSTLSQKSAHTPAVQLLDAVARVWKAGYPVRFDSLFSVPHTSVTLPGYCFARTVHWPKIALHRINSSTDHQVASEPDIALANEIDQALHPSEPEPKEVRGRIVELIAEFLGLETVDLERTFWELGGTSLVGIQLIARLRDTFNSNVTPADLVQAANLESFVRTVEESLIRSIRKPDLSPIARRHLAPVSLLQRRLWFLDQLGSGQKHHNIPMVVQIDGPLDTNALQRSLIELADRHEILRTRFLTLDGEPMQMIMPAGDLDWEIFEAEGGADLVEQRAWNIVRQQAVKPFDLEKGPLWRSSLYRLGAQSNLLLITIHHIASDGWSMHILWSDLAEIYSALTGLRAPKLPVLQVQYADFAEWQHQRLESGDADVLRAYWRDKLTGAPEQVRFLTTDAVDPTDAELGSLSLTIDDRVRESVLDTCKSWNVSLFAMLSVTTALAFNDCLGIDDMVLGFAVTDRPSTLLEPLIGFFINTLPLRIRTGSSRPKMDLVKEVHEDIQTGLAHGHLPYDEIVRVISQPHRHDGGPRNLFNVSISMGVERATEKSFGDCAANIKELDVDLGEFDFTIFASDPSEGLSIRFQYRHDFCSRTQIEHFSRSFQRAFARLGEKSAPAPGGSGADGMESSELFSFEISDETSLANEDRV